MALINCEECGKQISDRAAACPNCGAPLMGFFQPALTNVAVTAPKSRSIAVLLAMLLGSFGAHMFYLNRPGWGVIHLLFCWTLMPTIVGFLEGISYLSMSDQEFEEKYGAKKG